MKCIPNNYKQTQNVHKTYIKQCKTGVQCKIESCVECDDCDFESYFIEQHGSI